MTENPDPGELLDKRLRDNGGFIIDDTPLERLEPLDREQQELLDQLRKKHDPPKSEP